MLRVWVCEKEQWGLGGEGREREMSETDSNPDFRRARVINAPQTDSDARTFVASLLVATLVPNCGYGRLRPHSLSGFPLFFLLLFKD